jgi:hypothetical protein
MSGTHGDLFREIGSLVFAAHAGEAIDLKTKSEEMAERYRNLGLPAEMLAKAIARSLSAVSVSMALMPPQGENGRTPIDLPEDEPIRLRDGLFTRASREEEAASLQEEREVIEGPAKRASRLFPSGVRLGLLS